MYRLMDAICLSLAPNLRCQNLTFPESIGLIISPVLEVVFCIGLLAIKRGGGLRWVVIELWWREIDQLSYAGRDIYYQPKASSTFFSPCWTCSRIIYLTSQAP